MLETTAAALAEGRERRGRVGQVTVGEEQIPVSVTVTPMYDGEKLLGAMAVVRNNAEELAREKRRQTVEEYRKEGLASHQEKLAEIVANVGEIVDIVDSVQEQTTTVAGTIDAVSRQADLRGRGTRGGH